MVFGGQSSYELSIFKKEKKKLPAIKSCFNLKAASTIKKTEHRSMEKTVGLGWVVRMEVGTLVRPMNPLALLLPNPLSPSPSPSPSFSFFISASSHPQENGKVGYRKQQPRRMREWVAEKVSKNDDVVRSLPIYIGGVSLLAVLLNRAVSGIAPVADASSSQSRADLLTLGLAVTNILTGLVWLSIRPKTISVVNLVGVECQRISSGITDFVASELLWVWDSLSAATCCRSFVIVYDNKCILQAGVAAASSSSENEAVSLDVNKLTQGSLYQGVLKSGSQSYLANLSLYPGKSELPFLPQNTQAVILQPLGDKGIAIIGGDTIRGFTTSDQAWISFIGEKLDATLSKFVNDPQVAMQNTG